MVRILLCLGLGAFIANASIIPFWKKSTKKPDCIGSIGHPPRMCAPTPGRYDGTEILIDVSLGGQRQRVQFDTGSSDLAIFDTDCGSKCGEHTLPPYNSHTSALMRKCETDDCTGYNSSCYDGDVSALSGGCQFYNSYGDNSGFQAIVFEDSFGVWGEPATTKIQFGAIVDQHGGPGQPSFEPEESNGIFGTGFMTISSSDPKARSNPVIALAKSQGKPGLFSMCFAKDGGAFGIGVELPYYQGDFQSEPVVLQGDRPGGRHGYWSVKVTDIKVYGKSVGLDPSTYTQEECIVDSGTTVMMIPEDALDAIIYGALDRCAESPLVGICVDLNGNKINPEKEGMLFTGKDFKLTKEEIAQYPKIDIVMTKATVTVDPESYIMCVDDPQVGHTCVSIIQPGEMTMLGDGFLAGLMTVYDQDNMEFRFAKAKDCPAPSSIAMSDTLVV